MDWRKGLPSAPPHDRTSAAEDRAFAGMEAITRRSTAASPTSSTTVGAGLPFPAAAPAATSWAALDAGVRALIEHHARSVGSAGPTYHAGQRHGAGAYLPGTPNAAGSGSPLFSRAVTPPPAVSPSLHLYGAIISPTSAHPHVLASAGSASSFVEVAGAFGRSAVPVRVPPMAASFSFPVSSCSSSSGAVSNTRGSTAGFASGAVEGRRQRGGSSPGRAGCALLPPPLNLVPPFRFAAVEEGVYRGAYPVLRNFTFLESLRLKTIVQLTPEEPTYDLAQFAAAHGITVQHIQAERFKGESQLLPTDLNTALQVLMNAEMHPVYVHCLDGRQVVGLVVMVLRRLMGWDVQSSHHEFLRFAKAAEDEVAFVTDFVGPITIPQRVPRWLWSGSWADAYGNPKPRLQHNTVKMKFPASAATTAAAAAAAAALRSSPLTSPQRQRHLLSSPGTGPSTVASSPATVDGAHLQPPQASMAGATEHQLPLTPDVSSTAGSALAQGSTAWPEPPPSEAATADRLNASAAASGVQTPLPPPTPQSAAEGVQMLGGSAPLAAGRPPPLSGVTDAPAPAMFIDVAGVQPMRCVPAVDAGASEGPPHPRAPAATIVGDGGDTLIAPSGSVSAAASRDGSASASPAPTPVSRSSIVSAAAAAPLLPPSAESSFASLPLRASEASGRPHSGQAALSPYGTALPSRQHTPRSGSATTAGLGPLALSVTMMLASDSTAAGRLSRGAPTALTTVGGSAVRAEPINTDGAVACTRSAPPIELCETVGEASGSAASSAHGGASGSGASVSRKIRRRNSR